MNKLPKHLGGHGNVTHVDDGALSFIKDKFDIKSMLDIGCGPGGMCAVAANNDIKWTGIDGDWTLVEYWNKTFEHEDYGKVVCFDFTQHDKAHNISLARKLGGFDLAWSVEFLEHVEEKHIPEFMRFFSLCEYVVATHAQPDGSPGHHHVNEQWPDYWIEQFGKYGFEHDADISEQIKQHSTMRREFMKDTCMFFKARP